MADRTRWAKYRRVQRTKVEYRAAVQQYVGLAALGIAEHQEAAALRAILDFGMVLLCDMKPESPASAQFVIKDMSWLQDLQLIQEWFDKGKSDLYHIDPEWMKLLGGAE